MKILPKLCSQVVMASTCAASGIRMISSTALLSEKAPSRAYLSALLQSGVLEEMLIERHARFVGSPETAG